MCATDTKRSGSAQSIGCRGPRPNPFDTIVDEHALQVRLCDVLEHIADTSIAVGASLLVCS
jgi:hypothetical protein